MSTYCEKSTRLMSTSEWGLNGRVYKTDVRSTTSSIDTTSKRKRRVLKKKEKQSKKIKKE